MLLLSKTTCLAILTAVAVADQGSNTTDATAAAEAAQRELEWSYGRSEPFYPTPQSNGVGDWADAYNKAKALVSQMTNDEKNNMTYGFATTANGCSGVSGSVPRLNFPGLCLQDAGNGVRGTDFVNAYPAGVHVGAAWNKDLAHQRGLHMGKEFEVKGVNVALGPVVGPVGRVARGGRNWEGFSNDPYLTGSLAFETVIGMQENVVACVKHIVGNEQETMRNPPMLYESYNNSLSVDIDDKTMHELYLWPFQDTVKAGAGSMMASYNRVNNSYASQNSKVLNGLLKHELGFQGFVVSDWSAQHTGIGSANAGLDMAMPSSKYWLDGNLTLAVSNGTVSQERLDDMAIRIVAAWYKYSDESAQGQGMPYNLLAPHEIVDARDPASKPILFQGAVEGHVLVKNTDNALPLKDPKLVSIFGYDAQAAQIGFPDVNQATLSNFGLLNTLTYTNGSAVDAFNIQTLFLSCQDPYMEGPGVSLNGTLICGGGSGANTPAYIDAPLDAFAREAYESDFNIAYDVVSINPNVQPESDACIVFVNDLASEGWDRPNLADPLSDELIQNVASNCSNTIVVIHNAGVRLVDRWIDHENITAVIYGHLPGQDSGRAITEIIFGRQSPSGRLPYTVAKNESDYGHLLNPVYPQDDAPYYPQDNFTEGVYIDYKHFIKNNIEPRYAFGYGLTYTEFTYSNLNVSTATGVNTEEYPPSDEITEGGVASLWDVIATVTVTVENTGNYTASEVAQLYVGIPDAPEKQLRGYEKQAIAPGDSAEFVFQLTRRDLSTWDVVAQKWKLASGDYQIYVGKSVLDIQQQSTLFI
ncbi:putative beta-glucosidase M [Cyberlindnera fabianii]|uniref:Probable beta-glucosidase M n=1 Tax=Cyberlindnera fabianii TaxID=36022 RepID=A0A1V2LC97_CYBFA|nr:putative beta-glucosidase M [Cyberlindnera fabianii]